MDAQEFRLQRECTIIHEAAHAVVARSWGWTVTSIDVEWRGFPIVRMEIPELDLNSFKNAEVFLVGSMAECILTGRDWRRSDDEVLETLRSLNEVGEDEDVPDDLDSAVGILAKTYGTDETTFLLAFRRFENYVHEQLINEHWPAILTQYCELGGNGRF